MAAEFVTITWTALDIGNGGLSGVVRFAPNTTWTLGPDSYEPSPRQFPVIDSAGQSDPLLACDSPGLNPAPPLAWYVVTVAIDGIARRTFSAFINFANGASQTLADLENQQIYTTPTPPLGPYMPLAGGQFAGAVATAVRTAPDASVITLDPEAGNHFRATLGGNRELAIAPGTFDGQKVIFEPVQDATGGRSLTFGASIAFLPGLPSSAITLTAAPGARNFLGFSYNTATGLWYCLAFI